MNTGRTAVVADVDDVADMVVAAGGAGAAGLRLAAHQAHGALVAQWMRSEIDVVIAVGPVYDHAKQDALYGPLPLAMPVCRVLIDAPLAITWQRVTRICIGACLANVRSMKRHMSVTDP